MADNYNVFVLGLGPVGLQFVTELALEIKDGALPVSVIGVQDSSGYLLKKEGYSPEKILTIAGCKKNEGFKLQQYPAFCLRDRSFSYGAPLQSLGEIVTLKPLVVVDTTSHGMLHLLADAHANGAFVISANKIPYASDDPCVRRLFAGALATPRTVYLRATVGADIGVTDDIIQALKDIKGAPLVRASVRGIASGTNQFICTELEKGQLFDSILEDACNLGYTETRPYDDLSGKDVWRKAMIVARILAQYTGRSFNDITDYLKPCSDGIFSEAETSRIQDLERHDFVDAVERMPDVNERAKAMVANLPPGCVLRYMFTVDYDQSRGIDVEVRMEPVSSQSCFGQLKSRENIFEVSLNDAAYRFGPQPGAGLEVTSNALRRNLRMLIDATRDITY